jgi:DNA-binding transcriptional LysR family regulator
MSHLEIKHLRLIVAIARSGNLTRAAYELCLSQPAASKQLAELEGRLGLSLFSRTQKAMILTDAGAELHAQATDILDRVAELEARLQQRVKGGTGRLSISVDRVHDDAWLPAVMKRFRQDHQRIELSARQVPDLLQSVQDREVDVAIMGEVVDTPGVVFEPLHDDEFDRRDAYAASAARQAVHVGDRFPRCRLDLLL